MRPLRILAAGAAALLLLTAFVAPAGRADMALALQDARDRAPRVFRAEVDLGLVVLSIRLSWSQPR